MRTLRLTLTCFVLACNGGGGGGTTTLESLDSGATPDAAATDAAPHDVARRDATPTDARGPDQGPVADGPVVDLGAPSDATANDAAAPPAAPFQDGPYGTGFRDLVGPFEVSTTAGPWDFQAEWTGRDSHVFVFFTNDARQPADLVNFLEALWFGGRGEQALLLERSPPDVHYYFGSYDADAGDDARRLEADYQVVLANLDADDAAHWQGRLHFIDQPLIESEGWLRQALTANSWLWFGIDATQRMRQTGVPVDVSEGRPRLVQLAYEARYFAFEQAREVALVAGAGENVVEVPLFQGEHLGTAMAEVELPSADAMAGFDTLLIDLAAYCPEHRDENCGEWDYLSALQVCDQRTVPENPFAAEACQVPVPEVPAVAEVLGGCVAAEPPGDAAVSADAVALVGDAGAAPDAGPAPAADAAPAPAADAAGLVADAGAAPDAGPAPAADAAPASDAALVADAFAAPGDAASLPAPDASLPAGCRVDADCAGGGRCEGYVAPVAGVPGVPPETRVCECRTPFATSRSGAHTCNAEGTGFGDCECPCDAELGRWVTTYGREGRWVTDASPLLSLLREGGHQRLLMQSGNAYDLHLTLRLSNRGKGGHPAEVIPLWRGGGFGPEYNTGRAPHRFTVPEGVTRVELVAFITGHGWGSDAENCAEFCNHTHHFTLNGNQHEHVRSHPIAGTATGCQDQVDQGVVPNQYGTWPFGRSGWCPGLDVPAWVVDVTPDLAPGENELTYRGLFDGEDYVPRPPVNGNPQGFGAQINMTSYLVFWR